MAPVLRRLILSAAAGAALFSLSACGDKAADGSVELPVVAAIAAPAGSGWADQVALTDAGGMRIGNPDAPIKLIEFASLTCGHCADFSKESAEALKKDFVASGRVSLELRNFIRDPLDGVAATLTRCAGPDRYFPLTESVFAAQNELFAGAQANPKAGEAAMALPAADRFVALAKAWGIDNFFMARGMTGEQVNACLAKVDNIAAVEKLTNDGIKEFQVAGTPTFVINGKVVPGVTTWDALKGRLQALGAR